MVQKLVHATRTFQVRAGELQAELYLQAKVMILGMMVAALLLPTTVTFAQTPGPGPGVIDTTALNTGVNSIVSAIQIVCLIALPLLFVAGFGVLMYSGFSDRFRTISIRIIGFAFVGALGLFLFAVPIASGVTSIAGCTPGAAGAAPTCPGH